MGDLDEKEPGAEPIPDANVSGAMIPAGPGDETIAGENEWVGQDNTQQQTSKKDKKDKKKDKKMKKKDKKRAREEEGDGEQGDDIALEEALEEEEDVLPIAKEPDAGDAADERRKDKKDKKDKKKKEKKKEKKAKKRRGTESRATTLRWKRPWRRRRMCCR